MDNSEINIDIIFKTCKKCGLSKDISNFQKSIRKTRKNCIEYSSKCKDCLITIRQQNKNNKSEYDKKYYQSNCEHRKNYNKEYRENNKNIIKNKKKNYYLNHQQEISQKICNKYQSNNEFRKQKKEYEKVRYLNNKEYIKQYAKQYREKNKESCNANLNKRRKNDINFKLRHLISGSIRHAIYKIGYSKNGNSFLKYLLYTIRELKNHLEKQFEPWMSWQNHGRYNPKTWNDNDSSTWTWQIDHIIPQSDLPYISMEDENFKKCWELKNLRPLSAKQNILDGTSRTRHI